jgi:hypothetical protein
MANHAVLTKRLTVVARDDDDRALVERMVLERCEDSPKLLIDEGDFTIVARA